MEVDVQPEDNNLKLDGNKGTESGILHDDKQESTKSPDMKREKDYSIKTFSGTSHSNLPCKKGKELRFGIESILDRPDGSKVKSTSEDGAKKNHEEETNSGVSSASQIFKSALPVAVRNPFLLDNYFGSSSSFPQFGPCITSPDILWSWRESNKEKFNMTRRVGHPYQNRTPPKRKKPRTSFTRMTIMELEKRFERQKYLASSERSSLAKSLKISDSQVKTWFQNRRTKWRRQAAEEKEIERQTAKRLIMTMSNYSSPKTVHFSENVCVSKILSPDQGWVRQSKSSAT